MVRWRLGGKNGLGNSQTAIGGQRIGGKLAEIAGQYLRKGSQVYIERRIRTRKWKDKDGQDRYNTEIEADEMTMLGGKAQGSVPSNSFGANAEAWPDEFGGTKGSTKPPEWIDDLPF